MKEFIIFAGYECDATLYLDANAAKGIAMRLGCGRVKHLEVRSLWLQDAVSRHLLRVGRVNTLDNFSDLGTKFLSEKRLTFLRRKCGILLPGEEKIQIDIFGDKVKSAAVATVVSEPCNECCRLRAAVHALTQ